MRHARVDRYETGTSERSLLPQMDECRLFPRCGHRLDPPAALRSAASSDNSQASMLLETQACELFEPTRRDQQAIDSWRVEHEPKGRGRHRLPIFVGRSPQLLDPSEGFLVQI